MDIVYLKLLQQKYKYYEDKKITELTDDEIKEYLHLKSEISNSMPKVKEFIEAVFGSVKSSLQPFIDAEKKFKERMQ